MRTNPKSPAKRQHRSATQGGLTILSSRHGLTLVEMLVSMTATLILMGLVAQLFGMLGSGVNNSRSLTELNEKMRTVTYRLRQDLDGLTADLTPPVEPEYNQGYFELIEGPESDGISFFTNSSGIRIPFDKSAIDGSPELAAYEAETGSDDRLLGDVDDILLFTTQSSGTPFTGKVAGQGIQSPFAEVAWFCTPMPNTSNPVMFTLHRRQRIVMAHPGVAPFTGGIPNTIPFDPADPDAWEKLYAVTDVSCRVQDTLAFPNCLGDLTKRENRFLHVPGNANFPHRFDPTSPHLTFPRTSPRYGEDVILTNVIGFDVRVWDPGAPVQIISSPPDDPLLVGPNDPGYVHLPLPFSDGLPTHSVPRTGSYVDLGYFDFLVDLKRTFNLGSVHPANRYSDPFDRPRHEPFEDWRPGIPHVRAELHRYPAPRSQLHANGTLPSYLVERTYDTWSTHYERNGWDEDEDGILDDFNNGIDDDGLNGIDDLAELETLPPYPAGLRGLEVRIRCYEPASRRVLQFSIRHTFQ